MPDALGYGDRRKPLCFAEEKHIRRLDAEVNSGPRGTRLSGCGRERHSQTFEVETGVHGFTPPCLWFSFVPSAQIAGLAANDTSVRPHGLPDGADAGQRAWCAKNVPLGDG
jgi:hypothetical protein